GPPSTTTCVPYTTLFRSEREGGRIQIVHTGVGGINENDITLAEVTEAVIVGFNVRPEPKARKAAEAAGIEIRTYGIIYELLDELDRKSTRLNSSHVKISY